MYNLIITTTLFFCLSCNTNETTVEPTKNKGISMQDEIKYSESLTIEKPDYSIKIEVINQKSEHPTLKMSMELKNDSYYASPLTNVDLKGKFFYDFGEYVNLEFHQEVIENPISPQSKNVKENILEPSWAVKTNTTYEQELTLKTDKNFEVLGRVQFTIEPRCTFETIPFGIKYENGEYKMFSPKC